MKKEVNVEDWRLFSGLYDRTSAEPYIKKRKMKWAVVRRYTAAYCIPRGYNVQEL